MNYNPHCSKRTDQIIPNQQTATVAGPATPGPLSAAYQPAPQPGNDIPLLDDIVSESPVYRPILPCEDHLEPSADDQLARTNKYKTLTESDLERAEPANDTDLVAPRVNANPVSMLMLDECLIDDDLDINFDEDTSFEESLCRLEQELQGEGTSIQQHQTILPDLDRLNAELGVDPLPSTAVIYQPAAADSTKGTGSVTAAGAGDLPTPLDHSSSLELSTFGLSTSTKIEIPGDKLQIKSASTQPPLAFPTAADLGMAVDAALAQALPVLKQAVLQQLEPWLCNDSAEKP